MRGRFEGRKIKRMAILLAVLFFSSLVLYSQELPFYIQELIEQSVQQGQDPQLLQIHFEDLLNDPLNINSASESELTESLLFNLFQIASILDYRKQHGKILSYSELTLVDGFNKQHLAKIRPFISLDVSDVKKQNSGLYPYRARNELLLKVRKNQKISEFDYQGSENQESSESPESSETEYLPGAIPVYAYIRYKLKVSDILQLGITMENDDGEPEYPDFLSSHIQLKNIELGDLLKLRSAVLGDYSARMGQGLVLWNGFSLNSYTEPRGVIKLPQAPSGYSSSDEQLFYRGAALSFSYDERWEFSLLYSSRRLDANVDEHYFYSLPSNGLHDTENSLENKDALKENLAAFNLSYGGNNIRLGLNFAAYAYDKKNQRNVRDYNRMQHYDKTWGNVSLEFLYSYKGLRVFSELALDRKAALAAILGLVSPLSSSSEFSVLTRYYQGDYIAPHAGAYAKNSSVSNEIGISSNYKIRKNRNLSFSIASDLSYHHYERYRVDQKSLMWENHININYRPWQTTRIDTRLSYKYYNYDFYNKLNLRLTYSYTPQELGISYSTRIELGYLNNEELSRDLSLLIYQDIGYKTSKWKLYFRVTAFKADNWENRLYSYEMDLPYSFSVPASYRTGINTYLLTTIKALKNLDIGCKLSYIHYLNETERNNIKLRIQLRVTF